MAISDKRLKILWYYFDKAKPRTKGFTTQFNQDVASALNELITLRAEVKQLQRYLKNSAETGQYFAKRYLELMGSTALTPIRRHNHDHGQQRLG